LVAEAAVQLTQVADATAATRVAAVMLSTPVADATLAVEAAAEMAAVCSRVCSAIAAETDAVPLTQVADATVATRVAAGML
jgi:predicted RNA methylase